MSKKVCFIFGFILLFLIGCRNGIKTNEVDTQGYNEPEVAIDVQNLGGELPLLIEQGVNGYEIRGSAINEATTLLGAEGGIRVFEPEGGRSYLIQLDDLQWTEDSSLSMSLAAIMTIPASKGHFVFVQEADGYTLYHLVENEKIKIVGEVPVKGLESYVLKEDGSRIAYVDYGAGDVKLYNVNNLRRTIISDIPVDQIQNPLDEGIRFSPMGGYITFLMRDNDRIKGFISYGADSGKLLHDMIYGIDPRWNSKDESIAFLYKEDLKIEKTLRLNNQEINISDKIAVFNRKTKRISFLDEIHPPALIMGAPSWSRDDTRLIYLSGVNMPTSVNLFDVSQRTITQIQEEVYINREGFDYLEQAAVAKGLIAYPFVKDGVKNTFRIMGLSGGNTQTYGDVDEFTIKKYDQLEKTSFYLINEGILYIKEGSVYLVQGDRSRCILKNSQEINYVQYFEESKQLVLQIREETGVKFLILSLGA